MKRHAVPAAVLAVVLLPVVAVAVPASALPPSYHQGAAGIGDPYFPLDGNGGYDVGAYDLALGYDPGTDVLTGVATIDLLARQNLSRFNLDLDGLTVHSVTVDGVVAPFQRGNGELKITPSGGIARGERVEVVVDYSGVPRALPPEDDGGGWLPTDDGVLVAGEPHVAAVWFPANDHPRDKARFRFEVTVPDGLEVVANGALVSQDSAGGDTTWVWNAPVPMAPYLATVDIGQFDLTRYTDPQGRPGGVDYVDAVDTDLAGQPLLQDALARESEIVGYLATRFGPYPFADAGGIVDDFDGLGFALENQTRPLYPPDLFDSQPDAEATIVHELAHQWYGDRVAVSGWQHIWLNEGFATYAEWLWAEHEGQATAQQIFAFYYGTAPGSPFWRLRPGDPGPTRLFDGPVYFRGAMTLHALRLEVGNADFFTILRQWAAAPAGRRNTTRSFRALAEQVSGQDLRPLFDAWLFTPGKPSLTEAVAGASGPAVGAAGQPVHRR